MYFYVIPSFITGMLMFSWYSLYGFNFCRGNPRDDSLPKPLAPKSKHNVPAYMWDIYKNGISRNGNSGADIVKGVNPKFLGPYFSSQHYPNHGKQEFEFVIPENADGEILVEAEIRVMTDEIRPLNVSFQIFQKDVKWVFLDAKTVPPEGIDWVSLTVTPSVKPFRNSSGISFLMLTVFRGLIKRSKSVKYLQPFLVLSYKSQHPGLVGNRTDSAPYFQNTKSRRQNIRRKRNLSEHYEEETNRIWKGDAVAKKKQGVASLCRRKPLYIEFSDIDYDTWIVAPTSYEAFQCVGKCTFPVGDHLSLTNHAIIQTLTHYVSPKRVARACCVPTRLDPISLLYVDTNGILTYRLHYHGMVVAECGCRSSIKLLTVDGFSIHGMGKVYGNDTEEFIRHFSQFLVPPPSFDTAERLHENEFYSI